MCVRVSQNNTCLRTTWKTSPSRFALESRNMAHGFHFKNKKRLNDTGTEMFWPTSAELLLAIAITTTGKLLHLIREGNYENTEPLKQPLAVFSS